VDRGNWWANLSDKNWNLSSLIKRVKMGQQPVYQWWNATAGMALIMQLTGGMCVFAHACEQKLDTSNNFCDNIQYDNMTSFCDTIIRLFFFCKLPQIRTH